MVSTWKFQWWCCWQVLVDVAEQFFNRMTKELEHVTINRLADMFTSASVPPKLTKNSGLVQRCWPPWSCTKTRMFYPLIWADKAILYNQSKRVVKFKFICYPIVLLAPSSHSEDADCGSISKMVNWGML